MTIRSVWGRRFFALAAAAALAATACSGAGQAGCVDDSDCPAASSCAAGACVEPAPSPDAGATAPDASAAMGDAGAADAGSTRGLVAFWRMDEGQGAVAEDSSGNGNAAALIGATWVQGRFGAAAHFDGVGAWGETGFAAHLPRWTVTTWVRGADAPSAANDSGPIMKQENFLLSWNHRSDTHRGAVSARFGDQWPAAKFAPLQGGRWYFLAATYDGQALKAYTDGQLTGDVPTPGGDPVPATASMKLGRHAVEPWYFAGDLDETRVYDRALSAEEIAALFVPEPCTPTTSCAAQGRDCGTIDDGCQVVPCGTCPAGEVCGGGGPGVCGAPTTFGKEFFVAPSGLDANPGTEAQPFASLQAARAAVAAYKQANGVPANGIAVTLRGGVYPVASTVTFGAADSGADGNPIVYRSRPGEKARLVGGLSIPGWTLVAQGDAAFNRLPAAARGRVYRYSLPAGTRTGTLVFRGFHGGIESALQTPTVGAMELIWNGVPMQLARWPNAGENGTGIRDGMLLNESAGGSNTVIQNAAAVSRASARAWNAGQPVSSAADLWVNTWQYAYSSWMSKIASMGGSQLTLATAVNGGTDGIQTGAPFYAFNVLEELDSAGEYYVDRSAGAIYFWPPGDSTAGEGVASTLDAPMLAFNGASNVVLDGLALEGGWRQLVTVAAGHGVVLKGCFVGATSGAVAVRIEGERNGLDHCEVAWGGGVGVHLLGGDRPTLTPAANFVTDCDIHHFSRWEWTSKPGIALAGVGNLVAHNRIHDAPHKAIWFHGNNHVMELNDIYGLGRYSGDAGAVYGGRSWTERGNDIRFNYIHDVKGWFDTSTMASNYGVHGVYLDDAMSGVRIYGNVFHDIHDLCICHGGGRDVVMENNILSACGDRPVGIDTRAATYSWFNIGVVTATLSDRNATWNAFTGVLWTLGTQVTPALVVNPYLELSKIPSTVAKGDPWSYPGGSVLSRNVASTGSRSWPPALGAFEFGGPPADFLEHLDNKTGDLMLVDPSDIRKGVGAGSAANATNVPGWRPIPFGDIGPR